MHVPLLVDQQHVTRPGHRLKGPSSLACKRGGEDPRPGNTEPLMSTSTCCLTAPSDDVVQPHPEPIDSRGVELRVEWRPAFLG